jgi:hypothetical protein
MHGWKPPLQPRFRISAALFGRHLAKSTIVPVRMLGRLLFRRVHAEQSALQSAEW